MKFDVKSKEKILKLFFIPLLLILIVQYPGNALAACGTCPTDAIVCNPLCYDTFQELIDKLINILSIFAFALVPLMIVWAGMLFITGNGDPNKLSKAKNIMLYTAIGIGIILLARAIVWGIRSLLGVQ
jgi:hypothetical protein